MDVTSLIGLAFGTALLIGSIMMDGSIMHFWSPQSLMITLGGTFAAIFVNFPLQDILNIGNVFKVIFKKNDHDPYEIIDIIVSFAEISRREGLLALEERAREVNEDFLQKGIQLVVDGTDPELVRSILEFELSYLEERHEKGQEIFEQMGAYAPAFGMIGTLIGLIIMLQEIDDPTSIGAGMAVALITTFYGAVLANLVFLPIAGKLRVKNADERLLKEIMIEGILSIRAGENPRIVEEKLQAFLSKKRKRTQTSDDVSEDVTASA